MPVEKIAEATIMDMFGISWSEARRQERVEAIRIIEKILNLANS